MTNNRFAAFVMTYERSDILVDTIQKIFAQSLPPQKLIVVDNSLSDATKQRIQNIHPKVVYHSMGYNAGPAGAAKMGLELLVKEGYKWIYWGDDDDPPPTVDCFEKLIALAESYKGQCGQVGMVGHRFNRFTGLFKRTTNAQLYNSTFLEVDSIGGNQCKIISGEAVLKGVFPDEKLFFGFEELDFDLSLKKAGYNIIVHSDLFLKCRERHNRMNLKKQLGRKKTGVLWRDYYSTRNMLYIMLKNRMYMAFMSALFIAIGKSLISYKHGFKYGFMFTKNTVKAVRDFSRCKFYKMAD